MNYFKVSELFLLTASRVIAFHLDILGCPKGHKPDQNETRSHNVIKRRYVMVWRQRPNERIDWSSNVCNYSDRYLRAPKKSSRTRLTNELNNALFWRCLLFFRSNWNTFFGAFKKTVLAKNYMINRIMNSVYLIWKICHPGAWIIR